MKYYKAWSVQEMMDHRLPEPKDKRLHIPNSSGIRTHCNKQTYHKPTVHEVLQAEIKNGKVDGVEVCRTCKNKMGL